MGLLFVEHARSFFRGSSLALPFLSISTYSVVIDPSRYSLNSSEIKRVDQLLLQVGLNPSLDQIWMLVDQAWERAGCDNCDLDPERLASFYRDPVWLFYGMFIEQHDLSMAHRQAITNAVASLAPQRVIDFGGGFGTLARMLAIAMPQSEIAIYEPYPSRHGIESCRHFTQIGFVPELSTQRYDVLVSTDVLEHVSDPLELLAMMIDSVRPGGHLLIANCFYPVIACHLPCTFHMRYTFDRFCEALGLDVIGPCEGSHATLYRRSQVLEANWPHLRSMERHSLLLFPWREWRAQKLPHLARRSCTALRHPLHYPLKLLRAVGNFL